MKIEKLMPWIMVLLLFEFLFFMMPSINSTVNLFVVPISTELEISRSVYSLSFAVSSIAMVAVSFFYGRIYERLGANKILFLTGVLALVSCSVTGMAQNVFMVYVGALFRGFVLALGSTAIVANVVYNWFHKCRGLIMGVVFSAVGFGGAVLMAFYTNWVASSEFGWRKVYFVIGFVVFISSFVAAIFIRKSPESVGLRPYGELETNSMEKMEYISFPMERVLKHHVFWIVSIVLFLLNISIYSTYAHLEAFLSMKDFSTATIGFALSILSLGVGGAKLLYGIINDRFGMKVMALTATFFHIGSLIIILFFNSVDMILIGCIFLGFAIGSLQLGVSLFAAIFGKKNYSIVVGIFSAILGLTWGIGPWVTGLYYDSFSSYQGVFILFLVFGFLGAVLSFMIPKRSCTEK